MKAIVAVDPGNKNLDILCSGMDNPIIIPNVISNYMEQPEINTSGFLVARRREKDAIDITLDGKRLYLGSLAIQNDGEERAINKEKNNDPDIVNAIHMAVAYALAEAGTKSNTEVHIKLGTCLPIREYLHADKVRNFKKMISKTTKVRFNVGQHEGKEYTIHYNEKYVNVYPEGAMALLNFLCDENRALKKEFERYAGRIFIITDIGGGSTDIIGIEIAVDEDGQIALVPVKELIDFIGKGIMDCEEEIAKLLKLNHDYEVSKAEIDVALRLRNGLLPDGENDIDINQYAKERFEAFAAEIDRKIQNVIANAPMMVRRRIVRNILTGGSVIMEIMDHSKNEKISFGQMICNNSTQKFTISSDPLMDNVNGIIKALSVDSDINNAGKDKAKEVPLEEKAN